MFPKTYENQLRKILKKKEGKKKEGKKRKEKKGRKERKKEKGRKDKKIIEKVNKKERKRASEITRNDNKSLRIRIIIKKHAKNG